MTSAPRYQPFNDLPAAQYQGLMADIGARGIVEPIVVDEDDVTIDGHQRRKIAAELHIDCPRRVVEGLSEDEKQSLAIALNLYRRHLVGVERSKALQQLANLGMSVRRISDATGVPRSTVHRDLSGVRDGTPQDPPGPPPGVDPETGEVEAPTPAASPPPSPRVEGKDGKSYPAKREPSDTEKGLAKLAAKVDESDVGIRAATSKALLKCDNSGLLGIDPARAGRTAPVEEHDIHLDRLTKYRDWFVAAVDELTTKPLRSVQ